MIKVCTYVRYLPNHSSSRDRQIVNGNLWGAGVIINPYRIDAGNIVALVSLDILAAFHMVNDDKRINRPLSGVWN